jgi:DNA-directed RNA polymerase specialized sigma24 family protein
MSLDETRARFQTTEWTLVSRLRDGDAEERSRAMDVLVRRYWPAVYAWLRRDGHERDQAAEIVQHFFADVVLVRGLLERADRESGRLRNLLLSSLRNFLVDRHRRHEARGAGVCIALEEIREEEAIALEMQGTPAEAFERRWALAALEEALTRCERHFAGNGRIGHWSAFHARIVAPARGGCAAPPLARVAEECGFASPTDTAAAIQVVKRRVLMLLREVVGETVEGTEEQDDEFRRVISLLG